MSCVVVFGREPIAGRVKTRLAATVGEEAAVAVYRELLAHTLQVATSVDSDVVLAVAEPPAHAFRPPLDVAVEVQVAGNLGRRLAATFERRFSEGYRRVVVIGSDCPELAPHHLATALDGLSGHPVVLGPAADGGYWLVGATPPVPDVFSGIPWSTATVLGATRSRLRELELSWLELAELADLDTASDLTRVMESLASDPLGRRLSAAVGTLAAREGR
jgi:rSAM/selenodomain-associated transferase 1